MPKTQNARFEVLINGERRCVMGVEGFGVLSVITSWVMREADQKPAQAPEDEWVGPELELGCGGLRSDTNQHVHWMRRELSEGDEVTIRVLGPGDFDPPAEERAADDPRRK